MDRFYTSTLIARNIDVETSQSNYIQNKVKIRRTFWKVDICQTFPEE